MSTNKRRIVFTTSKADKKIKKMKKNEKIHEPHNSKKNAFLKNKSLIH